MIHPNQMVAPISRRARVHLNLGGLPTTEEEVIVENEIPQVERPGNTRFHGGTEHGTDNTIQGGVYTSRDDGKAYTESGVELVTHDDGQGNLTYSYPTADVTVPTPKPNVTVSHGTVDGENIVDVNHNNPAGLQVTLEDGSKRIVDPADIEGERTVSVRPQGVPEGATENEDGTWSMGERVWSADGVEVVDTTAEPEKTGDTKKAEEAAAAGAGASEEEKKKVTNWMEDLGLGDYFDKKQLANLAIQYLGSRILGYDHGASATWAIKHYGKSVQSAMATRQKAEAKAAADAKIVSQKNETMVLEGSDGTTQNLTVRVTKNKGGVESREVRWKGKWIPENDFYSVLGDSGAALRKFTEGDTGRADVNRWNSIRDDYKQDIHDQFSGDFADLGKAKGSRWASQIAEYGRKNLQNTSEESMNNYNQIVYSAIEMAKRDQMQNFKDHKKGADVNDIKPYLEMARFGAYTGAGNSIWLTDPTETDPDDFKFVDSAKVNHMVSAMNTLAAKNLGGEASDAQKYLERREIFQRLYNAYNNPANKAAIEAQFNKNIPDGMNVFTYFATSVLDDANISEEEKRKYGIQGRG